MRAAIPKSGGRFRAVAEIAAAYGILAVPPGTDVDDVMTGLVANMKRIKANRILEAARAIAMADPASGVDREVLLASGVSEEKVLTMEAHAHMELMKQKQETH